MVENSWRWNMLKVSGRTIPMVKLRLSTMERAALSGT